MFAKKKTLSNSNFVKINLTKICKNIISVLVEEFCDYRGDMINQGHACGIFIVHRSVL